jgi:enoyl-CoA hydratase/carnithine racemase
MSTYANLVYATRGPAAWITLNRPEALNSLSFGLMRELGTVLAAARDDASVRALAITGAGRAFCAGADLKEVAEMEKLSKPGDPDFLDVVRSVFRQLRDFPKPVIAAVNGLALAGGMELVLACDLVFAAETAKLGDAHANFGVFPGAGGAAVMPRRIGLNRAKYLLFSGEHASAREMMEAGLVNRVVPDAELVASVDAFIGKLATKSPAVLRRMKEVANRSLELGHEAALTDEMLTLRDHQRSYDMNEGLAAFREKRKPVFKGY